MRFGYIGLAEAHPTVVRQLVRGLACIRRLPRLAQLPFNFKLIQTEWDAEAVADVIRRYEAALPAWAQPKVQYGLCVVSSSSNKADAQAFVNEVLSPAGQAKLLAAGTRKIAQKVIEEAGEVAIEAVKHRTVGVVRESADLLYHLVALWRHAGVDPGVVWNEMQRRADTLGIAEKLPKPSARHSSRD